MRRASAVWIVDSSSPIIRRRSISSSRDRPVASTCWIFASNSRRVSISFLKPSSETSRSPPDSSSSSLRSRSAYCWISGSSATDEADGPGAGAGSCFLPHPARLTAIAATAAPTTRRCFIVPSIRSPGEADSVGLVGRLQRHARHERLLVDVGEILLVEQVLDVSDDAEAIRLQARPQVGVIVARHEERKALVAPRERGQIAVGLVAIEPLGAHEAFPGRADRERVLC